MLFSSHTKLYFAIEKCSSTETLPDSSFPWRPKPLSSNHQIQPLIEMKRNRYERTRVLRAQSFQFCILEGEMELPGATVLKWCAKATSN